MFRECWARRLQATMLSIRFKKSFLPFHSAPDKLNSPIKLIKMKTRKYILLWMKPYQRSQGTKLIRNPKSSLQFFHSSKSTTTPKKSRKSSYFVCCLQIINLFSFLSLLFFDPSIMHHSDESFCWNATPQSMVIIWMNTK